jgi:hypothetical protein
MRYWIILLLDPSAIVLILFNLEQGGPNIFFPRPFLLPVVPKNQETRASTTFGKQQPLVFNYNNTYSEQITELQSDTVLPGKLHNLLLVFTVNNMYDTLTRSRGWDKDHEFLNPSE